MRLEIRVRKHTEIFIILLPPAKTFQLFNKFIPNMSDLTDPHRDLLNKRTSFTCKSIMNKKSTKSPKNVL